MSRRRVHKWLEPASSGVESYIVTSIEDGPIEDLYDYRAIDLTLADCQGRISLSFGYEDKKGWRRMKRKWGVMIAEMDKIGEALEEYEG